MKGLIWYMYSRRTHPNNHQYACLLPGRQVLPSVQHRNPCPRYGRVGPEHRWEHVQSRIQPMSWLLLFPFLYFTSSPYIPRSLEAITLGTIAPKVFSFFHSLYHMQRSYSSRADSTLFFRAGGLCWWNAGR